MLNNLQQGINEGQYLADGSDQSYTEFLKRMTVIHGNLQQQQIQLDQARRQGDADYNTQIAGQYTLAEQNAALKARQMATYQIASLRQNLQSQTFISDYNQAIGIQNAGAIRDAALQDQLTVNKEAAERVGQVKSGFAAAGIIVGSGSGADVANQVASQTFQAADKNFSAQLTKSADIMNQVSAQKVNEYMNTAMESSQENFINQQLNTRLQPGIAPSLSGQPANGLTVMIGG